MLNKLFIAIACVLLIIITTASGQINLSAGLIAYYPLNNSPLDSTSNHLDLTATGSPTGTMDRFGVLPGAYSFNSTTPDYFTAALDPLLAPTEITVAAWVNLADALHDQKIVGRAEVNGGGYLMGVDSNKIDAEIWDLTGTHYRLKVKYVTSNTWTHLAMSYKAGEYLRVYIDGVYKDSIAAGSNGVGTTAFWTLTVGGAPWQPTALNPNGAIDDIYIYNRALNNAEVEALFNNSPTHIGGIESRIHTIYPVPLTDGNLTIDFNHSARPSEVIITDVTGKKVFATGIKNPARESFDLSRLKNGVYSVLIISENKSEVHSLVIAK